MRDGYLLHPTKEEFFKTKHPFATLPMILPACIYSLITRLLFWNSWWLLLGSLGALIFGTGLSYFVAIRLNVYDKYSIPLLHTILGGILIVVSTVAML